MKQLISDKDMHTKDADINVQSVNMEAYSKETLEGKIDLKKIVEIRKALRRRYATRTNF